MPVLEEIRIMVDVITKLTLYKAKLVEKAVGFGIKWQELAFISMFDAIKVYKLEHPESSLSDAHKEVKKFMTTFVHNNVQTTESD